jgi:hypothetical protein
MHICPLLALFSICANILVMRTADPVPSGTGETPVLPSPRRKTLPLAAGLVLWVVVYHFLDPATTWLACTALCTRTSWAFKESVRFFLYDAPKVLLLLVLVVFGVGLIRSFFTPERTRQMLAGKRESVGNVLAAALGTVTPFCSCSAVPLFIGFVTAGVPLGVTLSFLIAAPLVNEVALILLLGAFGWQVAGLYLATGLTIAVLAGGIIGRLHMAAYGKIRGAVGLRDAGRATRRPVRPADLERAPGLRAG